MLPLETPIQRQKPQEHHAFPRTYFWTKGKAEKFWLGMRPDTRVGSKKRRDSEGTRTPKKIPQKANCEFYVLVLFKIIILLRILVPSPPLLLSPSLSNENRILAARGRPTAPANISRCKFRLPESFLFGPPHRVCQARPRQPVFNFQLVGRLQTRQGPRLVRAVRP